MSAPPRHSADGSNHESSLDHHSRASSKVWPVLSVVLIVLSVAYGAVPPFRDQVNASVTREDAPFLELSAVPLDASRLGTKCTAATRPGTVDVIFAARSHYAQRESFVYQLSVTHGDDDRRAGQTFGGGATGRLRVDPGATRSAEVEVAVPQNGSFDVRITVPQTGQYILLHCGELA